MRSSYVLRIRFLSLFFVLFASVLVGKLYLVQIVQGNDYAKRADRQYVHPVGSTFERGSIFFKSKDGNLISAATLQSGFFLALNPKKIEDPEALYTALSPLVTLDREDFLARANKKEDPYEEVAHRISEDVGVKIKALKLPEVSLYKEQWRFYPGGALAAHTVGFMGYQGDILAGRYGLERQYESVLTRNEGNLYVNFFAQVFSDVHRVLVEAENPLEEGDVITTIEPSVEVHLENVLQGIKEKWNSKAVGGIIMDPTTGKIFAIASLPSFDLNRYGTVKDSNLFSNPLVNDVYEMGSIIKPLTMAAGIDAGVITPQTTYNDMGSMTLNGKTISNFDGKARGTVPMQEVLSQSLNTGVTTIMLKLGRERFSEYFTKYEFGRKSGIDLPGEAAGLVKNLESPRDIEHATASFGQGIAMTPISTVRALSALANKGFLPTPHVMDAVRSTVGYTKEIPHPPGPKVFSPETAEVVTKMLVRVVDEALAGGVAKLDHYSVAAKTGTAQIANPSGGGYYDDRYLHSFFGYFPAYSPRFIIFLYNLEPKGAQYASETLTKPFMDMTKFLIDYYAIAPDR